MLAFCWNFCPRWTRFLSDPDISLTIRLSSGKLGPRLCEIYLDVLHHADQILSMAESRYDSEQIKDLPCSFKSIRIPCTAVNSPESYSCRIDFLSRMCNADIQLDISEDQDLEIFEGTA